MHAAIYADNMRPERLLPLIIKANIFADDVAASTP